MARKPSPNSPPVSLLRCRPRGQERQQGGRPRWPCRGCGRPFGPTLGTAIYRLRHPPAEVAAPSWWSCAGVA